MRLVLGVIRDHIVDGTRPHHHAYTLAFPWYVPLKEYRGDIRIQDDLSIAAELYRGGETLAELRQRFGVSPNAVRRALVSAGVVMRARGGSKPQG
jgi:hypothetical protein